MPVWLSVVAHVLGISAGGMLWLDFTVAAAFVAVTAAVAARVYPRVIL
ncbi:MAG TPA: hypothetical protein VLD13_03815 [Gaiellaceae bacterium]|nr:hypothetical protein [Gaiellaceae bacterium]